MKQIYIMDIKPLCSDSLFQGLYLKTNKFFRDRADRKKRHGDKLRTLAGGYLLTEGLKRWGINPESADIAAQANGKPYIKNTDGFYFNISHSTDLVICAFGESEIGADIEKIKPMTEKIIDKIALESERAKISAAKEIIKLWTRKESFGKCLGTGIGEEIWKTDLSGDAVFYNGKVYRLMTECIDDYYLSVCCEDDFPPTEIIKIIPAF